LTHFAFIKLKDAMIGILSDTHGKVPQARAAAALFDQLGVSLIIHCGDVGGLEVFSEFVGRPFRFVWGNTDHPSGRLHADLKTVEIKEPEQVPLRIASSDRSIDVFHGHESQFHRVLDNPQADYILHGHTHVARDERIGSARIINPGALHRARAYTVATLDPVEDVVQFHPITVG